MDSLIHPNAFPFPLAKVASLPYRFKAGGEAKMPSAAGGGHSHRATTKVSHKAFKSRKSTKGQLRDAAKGMSSPVTHAEVGHGWLNKSLLGKGSNH